MSTSGFRPWLKKSRALDLLNVNTIKLLVLRESGMLIASFKRYENNKFSIHRSLDWTRCQISMANVLSLNSIHRASLFSTVKRA